MKFGDLETFMSSLGETQYYVFEEDLPEFLVLEKLEALT